jgi:hypothetical protein
MALIVPVFVGVASADNEVREFWSLAVRQIQATPQPWDTLSPQPDLIDLWLVPLGRRSEALPWLPTLHAPTLLLSPVLAVAERAAIDSNQPVLITTPLVACHGLAELLTLLRVLSPTTSPLIIEETGLTLPLRTRRIAP